MKIIDVNKIERECENVELDDTFPGYVRVDFVSKVRKGYKHSEWIPLSEFLANNPKLKNKLRGIAPTQNEDLGIVSKSGDDFLTDISKAWKSDAFVGVPVWISRGAGEGQKRIVIKNTKDTIFVDKPWDNKPNKSSQYVLSFNVKKNIKAMGNTLPGIEEKKEIEKLINKAKASAN